MISSFLIITSVSDLLDVLKNSSQNKKKKFQYIINGFGDDLHCISVEFKSNISIFHANSLSIVINIGIRSRICLSRNRDHPRYTQFGEYRLRQEQQRKASSIIQYHRTRYRLLCM